MNWEPILAVARPHQVLRYAHRLACEALAAMRLPGAGERDQADEAERLRRVLEEMAERAIPREVGRDDRDDG